MPQTWVVDPATGCWIWQGARTSRGYAIKTVNGRNVLAYRWLYEEQIGPIPPGLELDHQCNGGEDGCANPYHVIPSTHRDNVLRGNAPTAINARKTACNHGHEFTPANTLIDKRGSRQCRQCSAERSRRSYRARQGRGTSGPKPT